MSMDMKSEKVDGILIDSYIASYYLDKSNDTDDFRVLQNLDVDVTYQIVWTDVVVKMLGMDDKKKQNCFGMQLQNLASDSLVEGHLKPVKVIDNSVVCKHL